MTTTPITDRYEPGDLVSWMSGITRHRGHVIRVWGDTSLTVVSVGGVTWHLVPSLTQVTAYGPLNVDIDL